jgi:hypothetical protein
MRENLPIPISNYEIDWRLKPGKDFPEELLPLILYFRERKIPGFEIVKGIAPNAAPLSSGKYPKSKKLTGIVEKQITQAEQIFKDYFLNSTPQHAKIPYRKSSKIYEVTSPIREKCAKKINARLNYVRPQLIWDSEGGHKIDLSVKAEMNTLAMDVWVFLAQVIDSKDGHGLNPNLVHQCPYCEKIFFSRQRKKFHPACKTRYFSEKAVDSGIAAKRSKKYREKKKNKIKARKKP